MCQILIHTAPSQTATDPRVLSGQYGAGDVIAVEDDTHVWGALDVGSHNQLLIMPGVSAAQMAALMIGETWPLDAKGLPLPAAQVQFFPRLRVSNVSTHATLPVAGTCQGSVLGNALTVSQVPSFPILPNTHSVCGLSGSGSAAITAQLSGTTGRTGVYRISVVLPSAVSSRRLVIGPVPPNAVPGIWLPANTVTNPQIANPSFVPS